MEHLFSKIKHVDVSGLEQKEDENEEKEMKSTTVLYNCETILSELQRRVESRRGASGTLFDIVREH